MATKGKKPAGKKAAKKPEEKIEQALDKGEKSFFNFIQTYSNQLLTALVIVTLIAGGWFAYTHLFAHPRNDRAAEMMFVAEQLFAEGDFETALNGDGNNAGFVEVVDQFGNTRSGRLAAHYAGISFIKLGDYDSALTYLEKFKPAKGATAAIVNAQNFGLRGDVWAQRGDLVKAAEYYNKAVKAGDNILTTPFFLKKAGDVYAAEGNVKAALAAYNRIKNEFGSSLEARDIDKYIGALEQQL